MQWMECIRLRTSQEGALEMFRALKRQIASIRGAAGLNRVSVLTHAEYPGDLAVLMLWENDREPVKSREGIALAEIMRQRGLIEHAVWRVASSVAATKGRRP